MALTDIDFQEGEGQDFIVELALGALGTPSDVLVEEGSDRYPVLEAPGVASEGDIFIIND